MNEQRGSGKSPHLPAEPIDRVVKPINRFLHVESSSGFVLLFFTLAALVLANSPYADEFLAFWETPLAISVADFEFSHSLKHWINDGLMVLFFFVIGLEVKREIVVGELSDLRAAALPVAAALGGMVVPAAFYLALQWGEPAEHGWGIPMATDIAFVVGCMAVLGSRVPNSLRILLLSLAIADDIGAILVIAIGYTDDLDLAALIWAGGGVIAVILLNRMGVRTIFVYVLLGVAIWFAFHESGVHATIAGVILGLLTPVRPWVSEGLLEEFVQDLRGWLDPESSEVPDDRKRKVKKVEVAARETIPPQARLEAMLHPWVSFVIMPLFAFANAGVEIKAEAFTDAVAVAVAVGLCVGKPVGIVLFSWLAVSVGLAKLPQGVSWSALAAGGVLAGIGFTMALFIAGLALGEEHLDAAKIGILLASAVCAVAGMVLLVWVLRAKESTTA